jgi:hypothetical protein
VFHAKKLKLKFGAKTVKFLSPCFGCMMFVLGLVSCLCILGVLWWNLNGVCFEIQEIQKSGLRRSHLFSFRRSHTFLSHD